MKPTNHYNPNLDGEFNSKRQNISDSDVSYEPQDQSQADDDDTED
jgi:hypothetical protein